MGFGDVKGPFIDSRFYILQRLNELSKTAPKSELEIATEDARKAIGFDEVDVNSLNQGQEKGLW